MTRVCINPKCSTVERRRKFRKGLCAPCYRVLGRLLISETQGGLRSNPNADFEGPAKPCNGTPALPGTGEKKSVLAERVRLCQELFSPTNDANRLLPSPEESLRRVLLCLPFSKRVAYLRSKAGYSGAELVRRTGLTRCLLESDDPLASTIKRVAKAFQIPAVLLL
jgi:hypothetical protein